MSPAPWEIDAALPGECALALELAFAHLPDDDRETRIFNATTMLAAGELDPRGILVARRGGSMRGVLVCQALVGATGLLWLPRGDSESFEPLLARGLDWLRDRGARLAEVILLPQEASLQALLDR